MDELDQIVTHLELLGYEVEPRKSGFRATHPREMHFILRPFRGGVLVSRYFEATAEAKASPEALRLATNELNQEAGVARAYVDADGDFAMEAWYPLPYARDTFAVFADNWHYDSRSMHGIKAFSDLLS